MIADNRVFNNPALRSQAARAELHILQDELILSWQVKWTKSFISNESNIRKERATEHETIDRELCTAISALEIYHEAQTNISQNNLRVDFEKDNNKCINLFF